jgi:hypothetical protein
MPVVGVDLHRRRSEVAVIGDDGGEVSNRNVPRGGPPMRRVFESLPAGTAMAAVAEVGEASRSANSRKLCPWAGLTPGIPSP